MKLKKLLIHRVFLTICQNHVLSFITMNRTVEYLELKQ